MARSRSDARGRNHVGADGSRCEVGFVGGRHTAAVDRLPASGCGAVVLDHLALHPEGARTPQGHAAALLRRPAGRGLQSGHVPLRSGAHLAHQCVGHHDLAADPDDDHLRPLPARTRDGQEVARGLSRCARSPAAHPERPSGRLDGRFDAGRPALPVGAAELLMLSGIFQGSDGTLFAGDPHEVDLYLCLDLRHSLFVW